MKIPSNIKFNPIVRTIDDKLLAGKKPSITTLKQLKKDGVDAIIDLRPNRQWSGVLLEKIKCKIIKIPHYWYPINLAKKMPPLSKFEIINKIIETKNKSFVHCRSGIHSTNIVCAASTVLRKKKTLSQALETIFQSNFFYTNPKLNRNKNKTNIRIKKLERLSQRLSQFAEMFKNY